VVHLRRKNWKNPLFNRENQNPLEKKRHVSDAARQNKGEKKGKGVSGGFQQSERQTGRGANEKKIKSPIEEEKEGSEVVLRARKSTLGERSGKKKKPIC